MVKIDQQRFFTMAECYDQMCQLLVPQYDFLQDEVLRISSFPKEQKLTVIDLGAGSGIFLEKILMRCPHAKCYWLDYSDDFLEVARKRLSSFDNQIKYILSPIEDKWENQVDEKVELIFSMSAIHHLESNEKKELYRRCFELLKPAGWFFNIDEMKTIYESAYLNSMYFWIRHVDESRNRVTEAQIPFYDKWKAHFDRWKSRNVDNIDKPKTKGDDMHESFLEQIYWLKEAGFVNVDLFIKYHLWSLIGGQKEPDWHGLAYS